MDKPESNSLDVGLSQKSRATNFEISIKSFLEKFQFDDIGGAKDSFLIGGIQVDVCGGHENTLLIIECTMKQSLGKTKSLRDKIAELRGKREILEKAFKKHEQYEKYKYYKYILAVKNVEVRHEDIHYANEGLRVYIWDENFINYYDDLFSKIKHHAKYNLLGEIGVKPVQQNAMQIPASMTTFGKTRMFLFFVDPRFLLEVSYVARRDMRNERYYQRIINKERLNKIAAYVNDGQILPNNIIIAFGDNVKKYVKFHEAEARFDFKQQLAQFGVKYGILEFPRDYRSCWIIDGQHRLYSFIDVEKAMNMPVVAFQDLDIEKQCKIFLDINKFQKPVSADLVWDLNGDMIPSEPDGVISNVVKGLNQNEPLFHKIYIPSDGIKVHTNLLKMASLCLSIKKMRLASSVTYSKVKNPFFNSEPEVTRKSLTKAISMYLSCLKHVLTDDWHSEDRGFVSTDGAYGVIMRIFEKIIVSCKDKKYPEEADYYRYLNPLAQLFKDRYSAPEGLKGLRLSVTSEGGKDNVARQFILYIRNTLGDKYFGGEIEELGMKEFVDLERRLKELIKLKLQQNNSSDWLREKISEDIYGRLGKRMKNKNKNDQTELYLELTLGECVGIMRIYKDIFYPCFRDIEYGFDKDNALEVAFDHILKIRTAEGHATGIMRKANDEELLKIYLGQVNKCLNKILDIDQGKVEEDEEDV